MMRKGSFPPPRQPMSGEQLTGAVTWFSGQKGFGFVKPSDGTEDVFVHISVLQRAGHESLREGATVTCEVAPGKKGRQVTRLLEVDDSTATGPASGGGSAGGGYGDRGGDRGGFGGGYGDRDRGGFGGGGGYGDREYSARPPRSGGFGGGGYGGDRQGRDQDAGGDPGEGVVKWFNATKGFGFITPDSGGKDVFLHASVVRRAGLLEVQPGQRVKFTSIERDKGPEARSLEVTPGGEASTSY